jgi:tetratricopeptide (TPR) repeat protein
MPSTNNIIKCANCGKGEECSGDLKACTACKMVKYCNRDCQIAHRPQHKKACKKRAAELHDEKLFKQPPPAEDCDICMLRLPSIFTGSKYKVCCGKTICSGCIHAVDKRDGGGVGLCPFCRAPVPTPKEIIEQIKKRTKIGDAEAIYSMGCCYNTGMYGLPQDYANALEQWHQSAELGHASSHYSIGNSYYRGSGVGRDEKKAEYYYELAAIRGHVRSRHNLGVLEYHAGNMDRALKHFMIALGSGGTDSLEKIKLLFMSGDATKDDYAKALQVYQANLVEIKSPQRDEAAAFDDAYTYY